MSRTTSKKTRCTHNPRIPNAGDTTPVAFILGARPGESNPSWSRRLSWSCRLTRQPTDLRHSQFADVGLAGG